MVFGYKHMPFSLQVDEGKGVKDTITPLEESMVNFMDIFKFNLHRFTTDIYLAKNVSLIFLAPFPTFLGVLANFTIPLSF
jgi:hypothetical protein